MNQGEIRPGLCRVVALGGFRDALSATVVSQADGDGLRQSGVHGGAHDQETSQADNHAAATGP